MTISDKHRDELYEMGCIICRKRGVTQRFPELHHITDGGRRKGDTFLLPLCSWHHRGEPPSIDMTKRAAQILMGPNLRDNKKQFIERYGTEMELFEEVENERKRQAAERSSR